MQWAIPRLHTSTGRSNSHHIIRRDLIASASDRYLPAKPLLSCFPPYKISSPISMMRTRSILRSLCHTRELAVQIAQTLEGMGLLHQYQLYCCRRWRGRSFFCTGEESAFIRGRIVPVPRAYDRPPQYGICETGRAEIPDIGWSRPHAGHGFLRRYWEDHLFPAKNRQTPSSPLPCRWRCGTWLWSPSKPCADQHRYFQTTLKRSSRGFV